MKNILGINCYHADSSACILSNNKISAAAEEERFVRIKHFAGFPKNSIEFCIKDSGLKNNQIDLICVNTNSYSNLCNKIYYLINNFNFKLIKNKIKNKLVKNNNLYEELNKIFIGKIPKILFLNHHQCHHYSSYFASNFQNAASISIDGFGDFVSTSLGYFNGNNFKQLKQIYFPHSLGILYSAITQYLGFYDYGDEYKVMGLAAYGKPTFIDKIKKLIIYDNNEFKLNLEYFNHEEPSFNFKWNNEYPIVNKLFKNNIDIIFKDVDCVDTKIKADIAASLQYVYEEILFNLCNYLKKITKCENIILSGGCAMNTLANGKIIKNTGFKNIFIQPAAADNGGAIGAAYFGSLIVNKRRAESMKNAYLGPQFTKTQILSEYDNFSKDIKMINFNEFNEKFYDYISNLLIDKNIIGWFQDKMEWGPRALGNRSILADPRDAIMKDIINKKIKLREKFRPFAPIVLEERASDWFNDIKREPFMMQTYYAKKGKISQIQAVVHEDNTSRVQTVNKDTNEKIYNLINFFYKRTGVPMLINTSLNENEPIICNPKEAFDMLKRTKLDYLILSSCIFSRINK
jgi:carbamoyltransferase